MTTGAGRPGAPADGLHRAAQITVIAGANGAGKSSVVGATIRALGGA